MKADGKTVDDLQGFPPIFHVCSDLEVEVQDLLLKVKLINILFPRMVFIDFEISPSQLA